MFGRPSDSFGTLSAGIPSARSFPAVPAVAMMPKPSEASALATGTMPFLSVSLTLMKTFPWTGSGWPAAICYFAKAMPKLVSNPITSPVDFISGPSMGSTPGNLEKGSTDSLTAKQGV